MFSDLKKQFMLDKNITYLNHGSFGACSKVSYNNLLNWQQELEKEPVKFFEETMIDALKKFSGKSILMKISFFHVFVKSEVTKK